MKQSLEILKSYFETGDKPTQAEYEDVFDSLVHRDEMETTTNTVYVSATNGNDVTAQIGEPRKPFLTIDEAIAAFESEYPREGDLTSLDHPFLTIKLLTDETYEINALLPQRNIRFESKASCTIDFSNNTNEYFHNRVEDVYNKYVFSLPNGRLLNNSENTFLGGTLYFEGEFDVIETYGAPYSNFNKGFISANQINVTYNLLKGSGVAFTALGINSINYFNGNIESVGADLMVHNEGRGTCYFDFDVAEGTHKVSLLKAGLVYTAYVNFGKHKPDVASEIVKTGTNGKIFVNFKDNAEVYGNFNATETYFTGDNVTVNAPLARLQNKLFFEGLSIKASTYLCTYIGVAAQVSIKNCHVEVHSSLVYIETNTAFNQDILQFIGYNCIYQTDDPGTNLVVKFSTAIPTNVSYNVALQNSLITNGILNTTLTGTNTATATVTIGNTNTY
ncbi:hypothetical protein [Kordia jejudonensis]|uniref:hypothetical protein n=1 Tax=Kordia jejudonensis TaxID=1348245 RepID=UPI000629339A|nr:hypothetical protein [Kordia jejudonensis]